MKSALLAILSGISWGASAIVAKRMYRRYPHLDLLSLTAWQMLYAALVMSVVAWLVPQRSIDWQPGVFGHWPIAQSWRRRWPGACGCMFCVTCPPASPA